MNPTQRGVLCAGCLLLLACLVYPPFKVSYSSQDYLGRLQRETNVRVEYHWIWSESRVPRAIAFDQLFVQTLGVAVLTAIGLHLTRNSIERGKCHSAKSS